jgi:hypothetical protein
METEKSKKKGPRKIEVLKTAGISIVAGDVGLGWWRALHSNSCSTEQRRAKSMHLIENQTLDQDGVMKT